MNKKYYDALEVRFSDYVVKTQKEIKELTELAATNEDKFSKSAELVGILSKKVEIREEEIDIIRNNYETKIKNMERSCEIQTAIAREATLQKQLAEKQAAFLERVLEMFTC